MNLLFLLNAVSSIEQLYMVYIFLSWGDIPDLVISLVEDFPKR